MTTLKSLLAATDFSGDAGHAVERAACIAAAQRVALSLLHVINGTSLASLRELFLGRERAEARFVADSREALERLARSIALSHGVHAATRVEVGPVLACIVAEAATADLRVVGARGQRPVRDLILGTTAERLLGRIPRPVLVVKRAAPGAYRQVVVPVDFSASSAAALESALAVAPGAAIVLCHAVDVPFEGRMGLAGASDDELYEYRRRSRERALQDMRALVAGSGEAAGRVTPVVEIGDAVRLVLDQADRHDADLVAIGKQGQSALGDLLLGSVTRHVLADVSCDVLVASRPRSG
ncbi:MAG: universal stress protein [Burkholderiales bacterium]|nr:universal stress protein [Burkholderiales bacterium]